MRITAERFASELGMPVKDFIDACAELGLTVDSVDAEIETQEVLDLLNTRQSGGPSVVADGVHDEALAPSGSHLGELPTSAPPYAASVVELSSPQASSRRARPLMAIVLSGVLIACSIGGGFAVGRAAAKALAVQVPAWVTR